MKKLKSLFLAATILFSLTIHAQEPSADNVLKEAVTEAKQSNKLVFLSFHASWCGWCHRMDSLMTKTSLKPIFDKHFVITHITVMEHDPNKKKDENPGGMDFMIAHGGKNTGIPYWLIFDGEGKYIANSRLKSASEGYTSVNGDNVGCPSTEEEVSYWINLLKDVAHFSQEEADTVNSAFSKKKNS